MQGVISDLFDRYRGKPILVIGGGPSVPRDLAALPADFRPALVLSANEHGCKQDRFPVDYILHCDKTHCMRHEPMVPYLRQFGRPLISKWSTADIRLEDWHFSGNSGLTAIAVAAALGGAPVVPLGIDFWRTGREYFWDPLPELSKEKRRLARRPLPCPAPDRRLNQLVQFVEGAFIRPMSGILTGRWPVFDPAETFGEPPTIDYVRRNRGVQEYRTLRSFVWSTHDVVPAGTTLKLTAAEAAGLVRDGKIVPA